MNWQQKIFTNMFWRNAISDLVGRSADTNDAGRFTPYFMYKVGDYQSNYCLYFPEEPYLIRYKNEIFNKLCVYSGIGIANYLDFHYEPFSDKGGFLRFLRYEISDRMKTAPRSRKSKYQTALEWLVEKEQGLHQLQEQVIRNEIEEGVREIVRVDPSGDDGMMEAQIRLMTEKLASHIDTIMGQTELELQELSGSLRTGNLQLNNRNHEDLLIQVLILLMQVRVPKGEQLLKKYALSDIASMLLHFEAFHDKKINTLQKRVGFQVEAIKHESPKVKKLSQALQDFFY